MGYYEPDCGYYEPSEFDEKCEELMDLLRNNVTEEIKTERKNLNAEIERLHKKLAELKDIADHYDAKVKELEEAKSKYEWNETKERQRITAEVRKERLSKILEGFQSTLWCVRNSGKERPKCDKCDENRYIHFKSPSGKDCKEVCECSKRDSFYTVEEYACVRFQISNSDLRKGQLVGWYQGRYEERDDYDCYSNGIYAADKMYEGQPYDEIESYWRVFFRSKEEAQKYADWLNSSHHEGDEP